MTLSEFILAFRDRIKETKGKCFYCGNQTSKDGKESHAHFHTRDHVIPLSARGNDKYANRVVCCRKCNAIKEDLTLHEFKRRSGILTFYAETLLGTRIDDLTDIESVTAKIISSRKIEGRSIKFHGKPEHRSKQLTARDLQPSTPSLEPKSEPSASNK
jgi:HNH endonuclease